MLTYLRMLIGLFAVRVGNARRQGGATLIEYALIVAALAIAVLVAGLALSGDLTTFFNGVGDQIGDGTTGPGG